MRKRRVAVLVGAAAAVMTGLAVPSAGADDGRSSHTEHVRIQDDCDPATFNANVPEPAPGVPACVGDGETTFGEFIGQLLDKGAAGKWRFQPNDFHIDRGDRIVADNAGGEFHTFSEVAKFGGGCVPELNAVLGLTPVPECATNLFPSTLVGPQGGTLAVGTLPRGVHRFQCLIHPWMRTTVEVRS